MRSAKFNILFTAAILFIFISSAVAQIKTDRAYTNIQQFDCETAEYQTVKRSIREGNQVTVPDIVLIAN
jgi:hypothetical protein